MATTITWTCVRCDREIDDGDGYLQVRMSQVQSREEADRAWTARHADADGTISFDAMSDDQPPPEVPWVATHAACDPASGEPYSIGVDTLRTPWALVHWTAHLLEKTWLPQTGWDDVLRAKLAEAPRHEVGRTS